MLEIIGLFLLTRRVRFIVEAKGYKAFSWQLKCVLFWFGGEILGMGFSILMGSDILVAMLSGYLVAIGVIVAYFRYLNNLPDKNNENNWLDELGQQQDPY